MRFSRFRAAQSLEGLRPSHGFTFPQEGTLKSSRWSHTAGKLTRGRLRERCNRVSQGTCSVCPTVPGGLLAARSRCANPEFHIRVLSDSWNRQLCDPHRAGCSPLECAGRAQGP